MKYVAFTIRHIVKFIFEKRNDVTQLLHLFGTNVEVQLATHKLFFEIPVVLLRPRLS